jgi:hypothetical protein
VVFLAVVDIVVEWLLVGSNHPQERSHHREQQPVAEDKALLVTS